MKAKYISIIGIIFSVFLISCKKDLEKETPKDFLLVEAESAPTIKRFEEGFEGNYKVGYPADTTYFWTGAWYLDNAMSGTQQDDKKKGLRSLRLINNGSARMMFNVIDGISVVTILHAAHGTDGPSTWELWFSTSNGLSWQKAGPPVTSHPGSLKTATFTLNTTYRTRLELRKISGGPNRLNIDNISVTGTIPAPTRDNNLALGNPSNANNNIANFNNYLMVKPQYTLSYNRTKGIPNWVSWHLSLGWRGTAVRKDDFVADPTMPFGWYAVKPADYKLTGFDKGHMCPSDDRDGGPSDNSATFNMTNMVPQAPDHNRKVWRLFENFCRTLAGQGYELYIVAGSAGVGGTGSVYPFPVTSIASGKITVPASCWKVALILPVGSNDKNRVSASTKVIAINVPNNQDADNLKWFNYITTVDKVEQLTGLNLFSALPDNIENIIESKKYVGEVQ
ncbi:MAG: DNA/RNA non-specific endonuclease [Bacteroidetes bacterium]|nr:DNA/RNA non-specific endonuclease [Bacteroidota bacterium]